MNTRMALVATLSLATMGLVTQQAAAQNTPGQYSNVYSYENYRPVQVGQGTTYPSYPHAGQTQSTYTATQPTYNTAQQPVYGGVQQGFNAGQNPYATQPTAYNPQQYTQPAAQPQRDNQLQDEISRLKQQLNSQIQKTEYLAREVGGTGIQPTGATPAPPVQPTPPAMHESGMHYNQPCADGSCATGECANGNGGPGCNASGMGGYGHGGVGCDASGIGGYGYGCGPDQVFSNGGMYTDACAPVQCRTGQVYAGAEVLWLRAHFQENVAIVLDPPPSDNILYSFNYKYDVTPRVWFGYSNADGVGVRARYWQLNHDLDDLSLLVVAPQLAFAEVFAVNTSLMRNAFAGPTETLSVTHSMQLETFDLEATQQTFTQNGSVLAGLGLRYASMDQQFTAAATTAANVLDEYVDHDHGFEGFGPTASVEMIRNLTWSGLALYFNARGSILFGEAHQNIYEIKNAGADIGQDSFVGQESMTIAEMGFGLQYNRTMGNNSNLFVRGGYEGQVWFDAGGPLRTRGDMSLEGISFAAGIAR